MNKSLSRRIAVLAIMVALLVVGKLALTMIPNVEVVSLLCGIFAFTFGFICIIPTTIFCLILGIYWGFSTWVIAYLIHFNLVCIVFALLGKKKIDSPLIVALIIAVLTFGFGVVDGVLVTILGGFKTFITRFLAYYLNGVVFVLIHIASNCVIFLVVFKPLAKLLLSIKEKIKL